MSAPGPAPNPSNEVQKLKDILNKIQNDLAAVQAGASTSQLENSSIEVTQSRGYIPILENGEVKHRIGRQPDGTITSVSMNNTNPPIIPNPPICTPFLGGVTVSCDGFGKQQFADFSHINVYVDDNLYGTLMKVPEALAVAPLTYKAHRFYLKSVNLSNTESAATDTVSATPNQAVSDDIAQGIISDLQLADDAVTAAKIAAGAVTNQAIAPLAIDSNNIIDGAITALQIAANSIQTNNIAAGAISADLIAANAVQAVNIAANAVQAISIAAGSISSDKLTSAAVTADKIAANAVTALSLAANSVTAGAITAGSVTADKLAAQLVLASTIIAGTLTGQRIQLDSTGLTQIDSHGNISLQLGNTPQGNSLTVIDSADPSNALASIGANGSMAMSGISINGTASLNGIDLIYFLNSMPRGVLAKGNLPGTSPQTSSEIGLFELACDVVSGRTYRISSDNITAYGGNLIMRTRVTTDGSIPKTSSAEIANVTIVTNALNLPTAANNQSHYHYYGGSTANSTGNQVTNHDHNYRWPNIYSQFLTYYDAKFTGRLRVLFTLVFDSSSGIGTSGYIGPTSNNGTDFVIEDIGFTATATGGTNAGSGTTNAIGQYVTTLATNYNKYCSDAPGATLQTGLQQGMAGSLNYMSMIGFNYTAIQTLLTGATIIKVELYLYSNYWALSTGGVACVGLHNATGTPTTYSFTTRDVLDQQMKKPQGLWMTLPNSVGTALQNGTAKGLVLDSRISNPGTGNFGQFRDTTYVDATVYPSLRITYTK